MWRKTLNMNAIANEFLEKQNFNFKDLICEHRYSIGAIIFSHSFWQNMGGWKVQDSFYIRKTMYNIYSNIHKLIKYITGNDKNRLRKIMNELSGINLSALGIEEEYAFQYSVKKGLSIPVTTEGIVFHFAFGTAEVYLMKKIFLDIYNN